MKRAGIHAIAGLSVIGAIAVSGNDAFAQGGVPQCADLPNPIFMEGTTAVVPVIRHLGAKLKKLGTPHTLLYYANEGCTGVGQLVRPAQNKVRTVFEYYDEVDPTSVNGKIIISTCNGGIDQVPDIAINDIYWASCPAAYNQTALYGTLPSGYQEFLGPVQGLVPIVASSYLYYNDIMSEELLDLYMCGSNGSIMTFTNSSTIYDYNCQGSGMRELFARGLGLANATAFPGLVGLGCNSTITAESMVTNYVAPTTSPDTTIGYTSTEFYDAYRDLVRAMKVRGVGQQRAYLPDSSLTSADKINLREGRYTLQGALKLTAQVDASGTPVNAGAKKVIDWMQDNPITDSGLKLPVPINAIYALNGVVPQCAMRVTKDSDQLGFKRYKHPMPCHCSFEMLATGKTSIPGCVACTDSSTCGTGQVCSQGYCE
jgi:hypothetical protein